MSLDDGLIELNLLRPGVEVKLHNRVLSGPIGESKHHEHHQGIIRLIGDRDVVEYHSGLLQQVDTRGVTAPQFDRHEEVCVVVVVGAVQLERTSEVLTVPDHAPTGVIVGNPAGSILLAAKVLQECVRDTCRPEAVPHHHTMLEVVVEQRIPPFIE